MSTVLKEKSFEKIGLTASSAIKGLQKITSELYKKVKIAIRVDMLKCVVEKSCFKKILQCMSTKFGWKICNWWAFHILWTFWPQLFSDNWWGLIIIRVISLLELFCNKIITRPSFSEKIFEKRKKIFFSYFSKKR